MRIHTTKEKLEPVLFLAEQAISKNPTLPILKCLLLQAKKNNIVIRATNLDLGAQIELPAKVETEGTVAVPGTVLKNLISNLRPGPISLEVSSGNLVVSTEHNTTIIKAHPADDFPTIPTVSGEKNFVVSAGEFTKSLRSVWYAASLSNVKPELSSVSVSGDEQGLTFATTDSFRLAEKKIRAKKTKDFGTILIPLKNIPEIIKILEGIPGDIAIQANKNQVSFSGGNIHLVSRIVEGVFPDYKQIIPADIKTEVVALKQDVINALKTANVFSDRLNQIHLEILPKSKKFELGSKNSDIGENTTRINASLSGEDLSINFNYKYIVDCFQSIDSDSLSFSFSGLSRPVIIKGVSDNTFMYIVMPMNK